MDGDDASTRREQRRSEDARRALLRADVRTANADARIADANARMVDADAQTRHAVTSMNAALAHMAAADAHMRDADQRAADAEVLIDLADERIADAAALLADARDDSAEYQRAIYHYTQLVRHRMVNPLQAIRGLAQTLEDHPDLPRERRLQIIASINEQAGVLERVTLTPDHLGETERELRPKPFDAETPE